MGSPRSIKFYTYQITLKLFFVFVLQLIDKGGLVPDDVMVKLISSELKKLEASGVSWLLDGFPRTVNQASALQSKTPVNLVIHLDVPFQTIIDRVKGNI